MANGDGARGVAEVKGQSVATGFCVPVGLDVSPGIAPGLLAEISARCFRISGWVNRLKSTVDIESCYIWLSPGSRGPRREGQPTFDVAATVPSLCDATDEDYCQGRERERPEKATLQCEPGKRRFKS